MSIFSLFRLSWCVVWWISVVLRLLSSVLKCCFLLVRIIVLSCLVCGVWVRL